MTVKERLEEIKNNETLFSLLNGTTWLNDLNWLIEQAEQVQKLKEERSKWKGKHSILKRKYKSLQQKVNNRWRYNRAVENESRANKAVLEDFRKQNNRYREALKFLLDEVNEMDKPHEAVTKFLKEALEESEWTEIQK